VEEKNIYLFEIQIGLIRTFCLSCTSIRFSGFFGTYMHNILKPTVRSCKTSNARGIAVHVTSVQDSINSNVLEISSVNNLQVKHYKLVRIKIS